MKKLGLIVAFILAFSVGCEDRDDVLLGPNIRIHNQSDLNFNALYLRNDSIVFENITSKTFTNYLELEEAYFKDTLRIQADSLTFLFEPDSIGNPLPNGLFTYQVNIDSLGVVSLNFRLD